MQAGRRSSVRVRQRLSKDCFPRIDNSLRIVTGPSSPGRAPSTAGYLQSLILRTRPRCVCVWRDVRGASDSLSKRILWRPIRRARGRGFQPRKPQQAESSQFTCTESGRNSFNSNESKNDDDGGVRRALSSEPSESTISVVWCTSCPSLPQRPSLTPRIQVDCQGENSDL